LTIADRGLQIDDCRLDCGLRTADGEQQRGRAVSAPQLVAFFTSHAIILLRLPLRRRMYQAIAAVALDERRVPAKSCVMPAANPYADDLGDRDPLTALADTPERIRRLLASWSDEQFEYDRGRAVGPAWGSDGGQTGVRPRASSATAGR
jgi:hypothetical protein